MMHVMQSRRISLPQIVMKCRRKDMKRWLVSKPPEAVDTAKHAMAPKRLETLVASAIRIVKATRAVWQPGVAAHKKLAFCNNPSHQ
ncbi:MAG: hypothetical protein R6U28_10130 [Cyclonatronaceae bacterium]